MHTRALMNQVDTFLCRANALYGEWAKQHGVTYNMLMVLCALAGPGDHTQKQIAEERMLPKQTVNTLVKELERQGCLCYLAGRDQKEKRVAFTEAGRAMAGELLEEMYRLEDRVMARMGPELCRCLLEGNGAFARALAEEVHHGA